MGGGVAQPDPPSGAGQCHIATAAPPIHLRPRIPAIAIGPSIMRALCACLASLLIGGSLAGAADDRMLAPADVPRPGTIGLEVDVTDVTRGIFQVSESVPAAAGPLTLRFPEWLPGKHAPYSQLSKLAGLVVRAGGQILPWRRDPGDVYAFLVDVPPGVTQLDLRFQFLAATDMAQGRIVTTPDMLNLQWESVSLYPAGYYVSRILVAPSVKYPHAWQAASALEIEGTTGDTIRYRPVTYETLVDSPVFAGRHVRTEALAPGVRLNIVADQPAQLAISDEQLQAHRNLVIQTLKLFGARHFDHYDFLLALSSRQGGIGVEHHRSSEDGVDPAYFTDWKNSLADHDLLAHEFTHSWNGKFRRPADLATPDFRTPMQDSLLWVYEGQTQFWGFVLATRAGLMAKEDALGAFASIGANLDLRPGRTWRPLLDTTNDPIIAQRRPLGWRSWERSEDYYLEGLLIWLEVDSILRERSKGARSLDDFARAFFGDHDGDWGVLTYTFDDVVRTLNQIQPYDWAALLHERVEKTNAKAPLEGLTRGGYRIIFTDAPTDWFKADEKKRKFTDLSYSGGFTLGRDGEVVAVVWDSPAFNAGLTVGSKLIAVDGRALEIDQLKVAIKAHQSPLSLLIRTGDVFRTVELKYDGGLRYPRLERIPGVGNPSLDALLAAKP